MADRVGRVWTGSAWEALNGQISAPSAVAYWQAVAPTGITTGTLWVDSDDNSQWIYNGSSWVSVGAPAGSVTLAGTESLTNKTLVDAKTVTSINAQAGITYTLALADRDKLVELGNAAAIALTVPTNAVVAFPVGSSVTLLQTLAGQVTIGGAGVTINGTPGLKLRTQWSSATLIKRGTDTWIAVGDLSA